MTRRLTSRVDNIPTGMTNKVDDLVGGLCFVKGTLIHTPDGLKPIEDIQVGDLVASKDESSGETSWKPVVRLYRHHDQQILNLTLSNDEGEQETFGVTSEHPFWVVGEGWTKAGELEIGDQVTAISGKVLTVEVVDADSLLQDTFNFEVAETHTYFVGEQGAWVHNNCSAKLDDVTMSVDNLVYRGGSGTPTNLTPRAKDTTGLSGNVNPMPGKNQVIDTSKLDKLCAVCDNAKTGHVSINPKDMSQMQGWIDSRGSGTTHPLTQELMGAVVDQVKK